MRKLTLKPKGSSTSVSDYVPSEQPVAESSESEDYLSRGLPRGDLHPPSPHHELHITETIQYPPRSSIPISIAP